MAERSQAIQHFLRMGRYDAKTFVFDVDPTPVTIATPKDVGARYLDPAAFPLNGKLLAPASPGPSAIFRALIETNDATGGTYTAQLDLYDYDGVLNGAVPTVVTGSALTTDGIVPTLVSADVSAYFFPAGSLTAWATAGVFIPRLSIQTALATKSVAIKMAELYFSW